MNKVIIEVELYEKLGHLIEIDGGEVEISAVGYERLNKIAEISLLAPDTMTYNGERVGNPHVVNSNDCTVQKAIYKCIAYGAGPMGNRIITSATVEYNPDVHLVKDLAYIIANDHEAGKITKERLLKDEEKALGYWVPLKDDLIVYCNLENPDINKAFSDYANNKAYAERISQTLAKRNALKSHPMLSNLIDKVEGEKGDRKSKVTLTKYYDEFDKSKILEYLDKENITILEEEYIELGSSIYVDSNNYILEENNKNKIDEEKEKLLSILKTMDSKKRSNAFKKFFKGKYSKFTDLSAKQLEMLIEEIA
ncbi:hypothetical protein U732_17 [Clostridium argentinense CDC 2741]|uniref:Uncharacterized protein n=2 Tax=Clostridium argentinense TaxID=29341 RepID=A0A0C1TUR0_9CLOT|nr:hypothetical protein [Clostridium argentinense]ARC83124.1 hypothetical protein RSJ17_00290 [Clostridium argentinense]KIE44469.1 hypothetical protein U732_17 [Clostridium argentinense CDC 2741]NFF41322.1 hypothetical protein [Clostridium argentinense]NFP51783.1 hypothetical protein [Clostridium argentinense]NFP74247.1 hypothetical protein [Clostridium argentinense]